MKQSLNSYHSSSIFNHKTLLKQVVDSQPIPASNKQGIMIRSTILLMLLLFSFTGNSYAQKDCRCDMYAATKPAPEKRYSFSKQLMQHASEICKARGYEQYALYLIEQNELDSAEIFLAKAEKLIKQEACSDSVLINTYTYWSQLYYTKNDFKQALVYTLKLLPCNEASGNAFEIAMCNTMIAQLFNQTEQAEQGLPYTRKAIALIDKIADTRDRLEVMGVAAKRLLWHYQDTQHQPSLDSSFWLSRMQLNLAKQVNNQLFICRAFSNLEGIAYERKQFREALQLLDSAKKYTDLKHWNDRAVIFFDKADLLIELNQLDEADKMADSVNTIYLQQGSKVYIAEALQLKERIAALQGDYKRAYEFSKQAAAINDSVRNLDQITAVSKLEKKYNQA